MIDQPHHKTLLETNISVFEEQLLEDEFLSFPFGARHLLRCTPC